MTTEVKQPLWLRPAALATAILFLLSWIFPIGASLAKDTSAFPRWWSGVDVSLAFVLAFAAFAIQAVARHGVDRQAEDLTYRVYRVASHALILIAVLVMQVGDRIIWINGVTGFLWRAWLGLYILPWWFSAIRPPHPSPSIDRP